VRSEFAEVHLHADLAQHLAHNGGKLSERMRLCLQWIWLARWSFTCDTVRVRSEFAEAHVPFSAWQTAVRTGRDVQSGSSTTSKVRAGTNCGARRQDRGHSCELRMRGDSAEVFLRGRPGHRLTEGCVTSLKYLEMTMTCDDRSLARRAHCVGH